jgi:hypothetical protein
MFNHKLTTIIIADTFKKSDMIRSITFYESDLDFIRYFALLDMLKFKPLFIYLNQQSLTLNNDETIDLSLSDELIQLVGEAQHISFEYDDDTSYDTECDSGILNHIACQFIGVS